MRPAPVCFNGVRGGPSADTPQEPCLSTGSDCCPTPSPLPLAVPARCWEGGLGTGKGDYPAYCQSRGMLDREGGGGGGGTKQEFPGALGSSEWLHLCSSSSSKSGCSFQNTRDCGGSRRHGCAMPGFCGTGSMNSLNKSPAQSHANQEVHLRTMMAIYSKPETNHLTVESLWQ